MTKVKKILYFVTQSELGGAQRYVLDLARNLKSELDISVAFGEPGPEGELAKTLEHSKIKYFFLPHLKRAVSPINDLLAFWEIKKLIKQTQPDIIHLNSSKISILGSLAAKGKARIIYTVHGWVFNEPISWLAKTCFKWAEKYTARLKDKIICVSEYDRQIALSRHIAPAEKLITIHNGIDKINFLPKEDALRKLEQVTGQDLKDKIIIGSIGNLYKTKGYEYLIGAANTLTAENQNPKAKFIVIGEGRERKNLENLIKTYQLEDKFILAGRIDNASELLAAFDVYVCSSVKEGLSYTLIEALQAGLPIIATDVGGNAEIIQNTENGLLIQAKNYEAMAQSIQKIISGPIRKSSQLTGFPEEFKLPNFIQNTRAVYNGL